MSLSIKNLFVHYGRIQAISGIPFDVDDGAIVSLVGNNGAGKSTLLKTVSGLLKPSSGEIWFDGKRIDGMSPPRIIGLGVSQVPQGRDLFPQMTVYENLLMGAYTRSNRAEIQESIKSAFTHFPVLKDRFRQKAGTLSGGEQEMLAIARALMSKPKLLLLDEPTQGLAPFLVQEVERIVKEVNTGEVSVLLVENNVSLALGLSDKVYIMEAGQVVFQGEPKGLEHDEYVRKAYLGAS